MAPWKHGVHGFQILSKLLGAAGLSRIVSGHLDASSAQGGIRPFESAHIVSLPAVDREGYLLQRTERGVYVDT